MRDCLIGFAIGLIVGWNMLPQPAWVKQGYDLAVAKLKSLFGAKG